MKKIFIVLAFIGMLFFATIRGYASDTVTNTTVLGHKWGDDISTFKGMECSPTSCKQMYPGVFELNGKKLDKIERVIYWFENKKLLSATFKSVGDFSFMVFRRELIQKYGEKQPIDNFKYVWKTDGLTIILVNKPQNKQMLLTYTIKNIDS